MPDNRDADAAAESDKADLKRDFDHAIRSVVKRKADYLQLSKEIALLNETGHENGALALRALLSWPTELLHLQAQRAYLDAKPAEETDQSATKKDDGSDRPKLSAKAKGKRKAV